MKRNLFLRLALALTVIAFLGSGCAKKPVPGTAVAPAKEAPVVAETPTQQISGIKEQGIAESGVADQQAGREDLSVPGLQRIHFDFNQHTLTQAARDTLTANAAYLKANSGLKIRIEGHCDERGSDEYNLALGERRARASQDYLVTLGIAADRLVIISYGEELPLDPASNESAWAKNRRAEFKVIQ